MEYRDRITGFLMEVGAEKVRVEHRGEKHPRVRFTWQGREISYPISCSPSDKDGAKIVIGHLRRMMGLAGGEKRIGERRERKARTKRTDTCSTPCIIFSERRDWKDDLQRVAERLAAVAADLD